MQDYSAIRDHPTIATAIAPLSALAPGEAIQIGALAKRLKQPAALAERVRCIQWWLQPFGPRKRPCIERIERGSQLGIVRLTGWGRWIRGLDEGERDVVAVGLESIQKIAGEWVPVDRADVAATDDAVELLESLGVILINVYGQLLLVDGASAAGIDDLLVSVDDLLARIFLQPPIMSHVEVFGETSARQPWEGPIPPDVLADLASMDPIDQVRRLFEHLPPEAREWEPRQVYGALEQKTNGLIKRIDDGDVIFAGGKKRVRSSSWKYVRTVQMEEISGKTSN
jgi:hypothetical protein